VRSPAAALHKGLRQPRRRLQRRFPWTGDGGPRWPRLRPGDD
jgi:hypothetical protein